LLSFKCEKKETKQKDLACERPAVLSAVYLIFIQNTSMVSCSINYPAYSTVTLSYGLQSVVRKISPESLQRISQWLCVQWQQQGIIDCTQLRIDSTVVEANIAPPSDSQLLNDAIRVLSRHLATSNRSTDLKLRFTDQRFKSRRSFTNSVLFSITPIIVK